MKCPNCNGTGKIETALYEPIKDIPCDICVGTGELPENMIYDKEKGLRMKKARIQRGDPLRIFCLYNNIDPHVRSMQERGFFVGDSNG